MSFSLQGTLKDYVRGISCTFAKEKRFDFVFKQRFKMLYVLQGILTCESHIFALNLMHKYVNEVLLLAKILCSCFYRVCFERTLQILIFSNNFLVLFSFSIETKLSCSPA